MLITSRASRLIGPRPIYGYKYASGREGERLLTSFAPRKRDLTLYIILGSSRGDDLIAKLGKHKTGKACFFVRGLADIDLQVLRELIGASVKHLREAHN